jgi:hypothetical protein
MERFSMVLGEVLGGGVKEEAILRNRREI